MGLTRRGVLLGTAAGVLCGAPHARAASNPGHAPFVAAAFRMKDDAVRAGDQAYGAVVVRDGRIVGFGPSRVVQNRDRTAHAEREAIREARARLGGDLAGCLLYSTSRPCAECEAAAAEARIARMYYGAAPADAGAPRSRAGGR